MTGVRVGRHLPCPSVFVTNEHARLLSMAPYGLDHFLGQIAQGSFATSSYASLSMSISSESAISSICSSVTTSGGRKRRMESPM